jgi:murein L,D-transpeptidase YcbB/YkuD
VSLSPRSSTALAAILLALAGCNFVSGESGSGDTAATAQAEGVTPEALRAAVQDEPLRRFYEARQWQSAWSGDAAEQLKGALNGAVNHGLDPKGFLQDLDRAGSPVEKEVAMSRAALAYADALAHGKTDPTKLFEVYTLPRNQVDVPAGPRGGGWAGQCGAMDRRPRAAGRGISRAFPSLCPAAAGDATAAAAAAGNG